MPDSAHIRVRDHISALLGLDDAAFKAYAARLKRRLSRSNPEAVLTRRTIDRATGELRERSDRDELLLRLVAQDCPAAAAALLYRLAEELPTAGNRMTCHLLPNAGARGTGNCFGNDRLLVTVPACGDATPWLEFVIAHEYSHTYTDYEVQSAPVRDFLISEGLAMVLAETYAAKPQPYPWEEVTPEQEAEFWETADLDARGLEAYMTYMGSEASYEAGSRVVRSYLQRHAIPIAEAHRLRFADLYWNSGYPFVR